MSGFDHVEAEIEERVEHEVHSLRALFRDRRLSVRTMDRPLRLATGGAAASLIGTVLLIALRDVGGADVALGRSPSGVVTAISTPIFTATLVLLSIGFAYVLTGAVLASPVVAVLALFVLTVEIGIYTGAFGTLFGFGGFFTLLPSWASWTARGLIALIWIVAAVVIVIDRRRATLPTRRTRLSLLVVYALLFGGYFVILKVASPSIGGLDLFPESTSLLMLDIADLVTPILFIAAVDFGEWGGLLGERVAALVKVRSAWLLTPLAIVLAVSLVIYGYAHVRGPEWFSAHRVWESVRTTLIMAVALLVVIAVGRALGLHQRRWPSTLNFAGLFAAVAITIYVIGPVTGVLAGKFNGVTAPVEQVTPEGEYTAAADVLVKQVGTGDQAYSILIPRGWIDRNNGGTHSWIESSLPGKEPGTSVQGLELAAVFTFPERVDVEEIAAAAKLQPVGEVEHEGPWAQLRIKSGTDVAGLLWARDNPKGGSYVLETLVRGAPLERMRPQFTAIANSFRPAGVAPARLAQEEAAPESDAQKSEDRFQGIAWGITGGVALILLALVAVFGRRLSARFVGAMLFFAVTALFTLLYFADEITRYFFGGHVTLAYVGHAGLLVGIGLIALVSLLIPFKDPVTRRKLVTGLIGLQATVWTLVGMQALYTHALTASRIAIWAAIIVLVAIAWDVVMSGESMTNHGTRRMPRATRVLAFLGYVILVAATVLFYSAQKTTGSGEAAESPFEPESITNNGLFRVAFPLAVLMFLLRFGREQTTVAPPRPEPASPAPQDEPGPEAVSGWASSQSDRQV